MTNFINTTPHEVHEIKSGLRFPADLGTQLRVSTAAVLESTTSEGVPLYRVQYGRLEKLPPVVPGTVYITSLVVKQAHPERTDFVSPGALTRDASGQPVGCDGFAL